MPSSGGATGSGKSGGLNELLANLSACGDVVVWGIANPAKPIPAYAAIARKPRQPPPGQAGSLRGDQRPEPPA